MVEVLALGYGSPAHTRPWPGDETQWGGRLTGGGRALLQARGGQRGVTRGGRGRGRAPRARAGRGAGPASRGGRGGVPPRGSLAGKRKFDGGHQNQGDSKRRFHNSQQQQDDGQQWYQDSFKETWG